MRFIRFLYPWYLFFFIRITRLTLCNAILIDHPPCGGRFPRLYCYLRQIVKLCKLFSGASPFSTYTRDRRKTEGDGESRPARRPWHIFAAEVNDQRSWLGKLVTVVVVAGLFGQVNHVERAWRNVDGCDGWRGKIRGQSGGITGGFLGPWTWIRWALLGQRIRKQT